MTHTAQDDDDATLPTPNKRLVLKPLNEDEVRSHLSGNNVVADKDDIFAELASKTAQLADQMKGVDEPSKKVLELQGPEPIDIFDNPAPSDQSETESAAEAPSDDPAVNLIRQKLNKLYKNEPEVEEELEEVATVNTVHSKHQQFIRDLTTSQKSLADIQTEWHNYYISLPDNEKREVWQEFYEMQHAFVPATHPSSEVEVSRTNHPMPLKHLPKRPGRNAPPLQNVSAIKSQILDKVSAGGRLKPIHHIKSLLFGMSIAGASGLLIGFVFFNEVFVAPFISPSRTVSATPIIGNIETAVSNEAKIIIPKINVEVPVIFGLDSIVEKDIQKALEDGVVHYATTPNPGEQGNSVIVGHSSNNILNSGKYKFAFVLLKRLEAEDVFYVQKDGVRYTYKVYEKKIVPPTDTSVLGVSTKPNSMTLITCDPPGTSIDRLIIVAEQISPDPSNNKPASNSDIQQSGNKLPSNAPSLWSRISDW